MARDSQQPTMDETIAKYEADFGPLNDGEKAMIAISESESSMFDHLKFRFGNELHISCEGYEAVFLLDDVKVEPSEWDLKAIAYDLDIEVDEIQVVTGYNLDGYDNGDYDDDEPRFEYGVVRHPRFDFNPDVAALVMDNGEWNEIGQVGEDWIEFSVFRSRDGARCEMSYGYHPDRLEGGDC